MEYIIEKWTINKLLKYYEKNKINLSPPYQRNEVWSLSDQRLLIKSIKENWPMPSFFVLMTEDGNYEMVDGQQRSRAILGYWYGKYTDDNGILFSKEFKSGKRNKSLLDQFLRYRLSITSINNLTQSESISDFYSLVNKSGLHLNRPELKKATYFETKFLNLITELADSNDFKELKLFTKTTLDRMNDIDFVSELLAVIEYGISDKKEKVDLMYKTDVNNVKYKELKKKFFDVIKKIRRFNLIVPIRDTRFKQKNDFYTLFAFLYENSAIADDTLDYFYKLLVKVAQGIRPSQEQCEPLMNYAINCVTQSNSKNARLERNEFLTEFLINNTARPNVTQIAVMDLFKMKVSDVKILTDFTLPDIDKMMDLEEQ